MAWVTKDTSLRKRTGYYYEGREIALIKDRSTPIKQPRHRGSWWPENKKIEAATVYAVTKNFATTESLVGIKHYVIRKWATEPWFQEIVDKVKKEKNEELDAKITEVLDSAVDLIKDRIKNGEVWVDKRTKEQYRVPMRARDAAIVTDVVFEKRQLIRKEPTSLSSNESQEKKLEKLKDQFEKLAKSQGINPSSEPLEGEYGKEEASIQEADAETQETGLLNDSQEGQKVSGEESFREESLETNVEESSQEETSSSGVFQVQK